MRQRRLSHLARLAHVSPASCTHSCQVGINVERFREEVAAKEVAKMHRLYSSTSSAHPSHHAPTGAASLQHPCSPGGHPPLSQEQGAAAATAAPSQQPGEAAGDGHEAGVSMPPAGQPALCADWEARQRAHEDANLGHFERILPSDDPEKQVQG
jgi:hypothetical protein